MLWKKDATREIILNLSKLFNDGILKPLHYSSYPASKTIDALKFLHDGKNIGKVVVDFGIDSPAPDKFLREKKKLHGYYLISGGTEGFGLATAKHLADKELEGVILLSRKGILKYDEYEYFKKRNVELKIISADVASGRDMKRVFLELDNEGINLKGIVHAATVYSDDIINNLSYDNYEKVLFTKIKGAHYLDEFSRKYCLDHFILFSSVSTFFGNLGQANYVAANGYLESLAAKRRNSGLKGNYIAWGGLSDSGVLTRNARLKKILKDKLGNTMISTKQALSVLDIIIESELPAGFSAMNYDLRQMGKSLPIINTSRFDVLSFNQKNTKEEKGNDFKEKLKSMNPEEVRAELISVVFEEVANILELKIDEINDNRPLREYGLDSLMGFDLAMSIEKRIGIAISALSMPQAPSIRSIADMLVTRLTGDNEIDVENKAIDLLKKHGEKNL
jgi:short-subunit dehydrogenase/acyl carrier protein